MDGVAQVAINLSAIATGLGTIIYIVGRLSGRLQGIEERLKRVEKLLNKR